MSTPVFWAPPAALRGARVVLDGAEGRHAATVRRLRPGERVDVVDGLGVRARCVVAGGARGVLELDVVERVVEPAAQPRLVVVQALAKGERAELAVEAMTEVGVDVLVPWPAARSVMQWRGERADRALERWRGTAREAAKQARRAWFPEVAPVASTADVVGLLAAAALGVVLHEDAPAPLAAVEDVPAAGDVVVVVGPEGGLTEEELGALTALARAAAYRLGPTVLRSSTAGAVALGVLLARTDRWRVPPAPPPTAP